MAKDPAFLFYPGDFNTGTQFFTDEQVGKYIRLLMAQHQHGHLTDEQVLHICKTYDNHIMSKFIKDLSGLWYNQRLENEIIKRKEYSKSRSKNRSNKKDISNSYVKHMENKNENRNEDITIIGDHNEDKYILIVPKQMNSLKYRINGSDGFKQLFELNKSKIKNQGQVSSFLISNAGAHYEDFRHVYNAFNKFLEINVQAYGR